VVNLVTNALEALPDRRCGVTVATAFDAIKRQVVIEVRDEGVGITPEHLGRLCDPFFTTKQASGGTGLGLAITSSLVRLHGGRLTFASEPGKGTRALVTFPCGPGEESSSQTLRPASEEEPIP
jgi:signal transduction histidine kinase